MDTAGAASLSVCAPGEGEGDGVEAACAAVSGMKKPTEPMKVEARKWRRAINGRSPGMDHSPDLTCADETRYGTLHTVVENAGALQSCLARAPCAARNRVGSRNIAVTATRNIN
jgi:hypothetical protein